MTQRTPDAPYFKTEKLQRRGLRPFSPVTWEDPRHPPRSREGPVGVGHKTQRHSRNPTCQRDSTEAAVSGCHKTICRSQQWRGPGVTEHGDVLSVKSTYRETSGGSGSHQCCPHFPGPQVHPYGPVRPRMPLLQSLPPCWRGGAASACLRRLFAGGTVRTGWKSTQGQADQLARS